MTESTNSSTLRYQIDYGYLNGSQTLLINNITKVGWLILLITHKINTYLSFSFWIAFASYMTEREDTTLELLLQCNFFCSQPWSALQHASWFNIKTNLSKTKLDEIIVSSLSASVCRSSSDNAIRIKGTKEVLMIL